MIGNRRALMDSGLRNYLRRVPNDSVLYYPGLRGGDSPILDYSGLASPNNGTVSGITERRLPSGLWVKVYDGTDDTLYKPSPSFINDTEGAVKFWFKLDANDTDYCVASTSLEGATDDEWLLLYYRGAINNRIQVLLRVNNLTTLELDTGINIVTDTDWHLWLVTSDGSTFRAYLDGSVESLTAVGGTNSGQWMAAATQADVFTMGAVRRATPVLDLAGQTALETVLSANVSAQLAKEIYDAERPFFYP